MASRDKLVELLGKMLEQKGPAMAAELDRRVAAGQPLEVRGICLDVSMQVEALKKYKEAQEALAPPEPPEGDTPPSSPQQEGEAASPKPARKAETASPKKAGTRWVPPGGASAGGARWKPGAPSATLLAAKAMMECERAESFSRSVQVVSDTPVALLSRPDMHSELTGTSLSKGQIVEVVARFINPRDGRVYVRVRMQEGWASTRAMTDWGIKALGPVKGESPIEPARCQTPVVSTVMRLLPEVAPEAVNLPEVEGTAAADIVADEVAEDDAMEDGVAEEDAAKAAEEEAPDEEMAEDEDGEGEPAEEKEEGDSEDDEMGDDDSEEIEGSADRKPGKIRTRKFRVVVGRCPILSAPNSKDLMDANRGGEALVMREECHADGYTFSAAEQRAYLRLTRGRGWIAERSRTDIWRFAVLPISTRKKPLSKKGARRAAFHGLDAGDGCKLRRDDLVKNTQGKIVSKKMSEAAKKRAADTIGKWSTAVQQARQELDLKGFVAVKKGTPVYERAQEIYKANKENDKKDKK